jgi:hypothetical protein
MHAFRRREGKKRALKVKQNPDRPAAMTTAAMTPTAIATKAEMTPTAAQPKHPRRHTRTHTHTHTRTHAHPHTCTLA